MFTIEQIREANGRVESGADFPRLARELFELGVLTSDVYAGDGRAEYFGAENYSVQAPPVHRALEIADECDEENFKNYLKIHQQGQTDYPTFCRHSAETGVEKWRLDFDKMTCTYLDKKGRQILVEKIPAL